MNRWREIADDLAVLLRLHSNNTPGVVASYPPPEKVRAALRRYEEAVEHDYPLATPENWDPSQLRGEQYDEVRDE